MPERPQWIYLLEEEAAAGLDRRNESVFKDVVWVREIDNPVVLEVIRTGLRKWVDGVENFAQYFVRRLQNKGLVLEFSSSISPTPDGYTLVMNFKVKGVRGDQLKPVLKILRKDAKANTSTQRKLKRIESLLRRLGWIEDEPERGGGGGDSPPAEPEEEAGGEGEEGEGEY